MRHQRHLTDVFQRTKLLPDRVHPFRLKAQTVHPAVHFEIDIQRGMQLRVLNGLDLPVTVNAGRQAVLIQQRQILRMEESFQQQDRSFPAALAQQDGLFQIQQGKTIGGAERTPDTVDTMTVGVGFHHRPDTRTRRSTANNLQVILQRLQIQLGQNGTGHDDSLIMRAVQVLWTRWGKP